MTRKESEDDLSSFTGAVDVDVACCVWCGGARGTHQTFQVVSRLIELTKSGQLPQYLKLFPGYLPDRGCQRTLHIAHTSAVGTT